MLLVVAVFLLEVVALAVVAIPSLAVLMTCSGSVIAGYK